MYEQFIHAENNIKEFELFLANISKSISASSDSFPLIMSHIVLEIVSMKKIEFKKYSWKHKMDFQRNINTITWLNGRHLIISSSNTSVLKCEHFTRKWIFPCLWDLVKKWLSITINTMASFTRNLKWFIRRRFRIQNIYATFINNLNKLDQREIRVG